MAAATITSRSWGFSATGGTDATTVASTPTKLKAILVTSVGTALQQVVVTTVTGTVPFGVFTGGTVAASAVYSLEGAMLPDVRVTLPGAGTIVNFIVE